MRIITQLINKKDTVSHKNNTSQTVVFLYGSDISL
jgi:hypothetical protein